MSSSTARGAGREQGVSKWRAGTAWKQPQRLSAGRCCSCGAGECPVQAAGVLQEADPSEAERGSGTVHRPGSVEVSVTVFYRSSFHRLLWRILWDPFPWESHQSADCNVDPALVHAGACCHCHRLLCLCTSVNPALLPTWYYLA